MEKEFLEISLSKNPLITIKALPGHFATHNAHINYYLDVSEIKSNVLIARDVASELAIPYLGCTLVDTIVCMEKTEVVGAYLAEELLQAGLTSINDGGEIHVVTPLESVDGKLIFPDSVQKHIRDKNIILLLASTSSGRTLESSIECLTYYGGSIAGTSILFCAFPERIAREVQALFTAEDLPEYQVFNSDECPMCKENKRLDALTSTEGYTELPHK